MNGDHAEFEKEHANTPPHERPDWPLLSFDARDWAAAFCKIANEKFGFKDAAGNPLDEGWMVAWFAGALMRGFDEHAARQPRAGSESKLVEHAQRELLLAGAFDKDSDFNGYVGNSVLELTRMLACQGHSGFSIKSTLEIFARLAQRKPLTPLTGEDAEWEPISVAPGSFYNVRCSSVMKMPNRFDGRPFDVDKKSERGDFYVVEFPYMP
jgi:hypothetical protein